MTRSSRLLIQQLDCGSGEPPAFGFANPDPSDSNLAMASLLADKWVTITGASSGFGAAAARAFAKAGANVLLGARRVERLEELAEAIRIANGPAVHVRFLDVSRTDSVNAFHEWACSLAPAMDVVVNNAGGALGQDTVAEGHDEDWETMLQTNVLGVLRMTRAFLPSMRRPGGLFVNIGSVASRAVYEGGAAYCAAKAGELQITRALRLELCGTGLRVATVDPGLAETEFSLVRFKGDARKAAKVYDGVHALSAEDVAEAILWVASRPAHVCIDEMVIKCTDQAAIYKVNRRTS